MHADEIAVDVALVRQLLADQFPQWAGRPVVPVAARGTDHAIFRLGDDLAVRLPRIHWAADNAERDARWLPWLAPQLPAAVPLPVARGAPALGYPYPWSIVRWLEGAPPSLPLPDPMQAAEDVGRFVAALQRLDATASPQPSNLLTGRGAPLAGRDGDVRAAIREIGRLVIGDGRFDPSPITNLPSQISSAWEVAHAAPPWPGPPTWLHGDLLPGNLLFQDSRLTGVIDWGGSMAVGDPAVDLIPAWSVFDGPSRQRFREVVGLGDDAWARSRGWALSIAVIALPYYLHTLPEFVAVCWRMLREVLHDDATQS